MNENKEIQGRLLAELDGIEQETTDKENLKAINNIRKTFNEF